METTSTLPVVVESGGDQVVGQLGLCNIIGTFARFFREQLSENVKMGNKKAVREGKWLKQAKTGYDNDDGQPAPNPDAARVREIFRLQMALDQNGAGRVFYRCRSRWE